MICNHCKKNLPDGAGVCIYCGTQFKQNHDSSNFNNAINEFGFTQCPHCGHIGQAKLEKILRKKDIIIFLITSFIGLGFIYLIATYLTRVNPQKRHLLCEACGKPLEKHQATVTDEDLQNSFETGASTIKNIAENKDFQRQVKNLGKSIKDFKNSLGPY